MKRERSAQALRASRRSPLRILPLEGFRAYIFQIDFHRICSEISANCFHSSLKYSNLGIIVVKIIEIKTGDETRGAPRGAPRGGQENPPPGGAPHGPRHRPDVQARTSRQPGSSDEYRLLGKREAESGRDAARDGVSPPRFQRGGSSLEDAAPPQTNLTKKP